MSTIARNAVRLVAAPLIVGAAALGVAGLASATPSAPVTTTAPMPVGPGYQYYPEHYATPAPTQVPGWQGHHGPNHMN